MLFRSPNHQSSEASSADRLLELGAPPLQPSTRTGHHLHSLRSSSLVLLRPSSSYPTSLPPTARAYLIEGKIPEYAEYGGSKERLWERTRPTPWILGKWGGGGELTIALLDKGGQLIGLLLCHRSLQGSPFGCTCRLPASASPGRAPASFLPPSAALALCRSLRKAFGFVGGYALLSANLRSS